MTASPNIILATSDFYPQSWGGTESYVKALADHLKNKGCLVHIFTSLDEHEIQKHPLSWSDQHLHCTEYLFEGVPIWAFSHSVDRNLLYRKLDPLLVKSWKLFFSYFQERIKSRPESIQFHSFTSIIGLSLAVAFKNSFERAALNVFFHTSIYCPKGTLFYLRRTECKEVLLPDRCTACILHEYTGLPGGITKIICKCLPQFTSQIAPSIPGIIATRTRMEEFQYGFKHFIQLTDRWVTFSNGSSLQLLQLGVSKDKVIMIRHGISNDFFKLSSIRKAALPIQFAYTGRIHTIKGIHTLLSAWNRTPDQPEQKQLTICGWHEQLPLKIRNLVNKYRHRRDIIWLEHLAPEQLADLLQQAHAVIIPSEAAETGPLSFHEAVASGAWVIASDIGGNSELADLYKMKQWLFPPGNPDALFHLVMKWEQLLTPPHKKIVSGWEAHFNKLIPSLIN